jgi:hypothetical protein
MTQQLLVLDDNDTFSGIDGFVAQWNDDDLSVDDIDDLGNGELPETTPSKIVNIPQLLREAVAAKLPCVEGWEL